MFALPQDIKTVTHPLVRHMYLKSDLVSSQGQSVLVIETALGENCRDDEDFKLSLLDLLTDLQDIKTRAEDEVGRFDRVDIRLN